MQATATSSIIGVVFSNSHVVHSWITLSWQLVLPASITRSRTPGAHGGGKRALFDSSGKLTIMAMENAAFCCSLPSQFLVVLWGLRHQVQALGHSQRQALSLH